MSELAFIRWIRDQVASRPDVPIGIGDDMAALRWPDGKLCLVTTDMLLDGSCFRLSEAGPHLVGRKAMAVNLSDVAAMAGRPRAAVISLGLPQDAGPELARELLRGCREMADSHGVAIIGGDTNSWRGPLVINVTLLAEPTGRGPVPRSGAQSGDWIIVTGDFGGSILGKHLTFEPRVAAAQRLHELVHLKAMIDVSDGLSRDLWHVCEASHCGAEIEAASVPISAAATGMQDDASPLEHALTDGEDFELILAVDAAAGAQLVQTQPLSDQGIRLTKIGAFIAEGFFIKEGSERRSLEPRGYEHRWGAG